MQLVLGTVGAALGSFFGPAGASIGWLVGSAIGGALTKQPSSRQEGPRMLDLRVQVSSYGVGIPILRGNVACTGNVIYQSAIREVAHETSSRQGGKGGMGGQSVTTVSYTYHVDAAILLGEGPIGGVRRAWQNSRLTYNVGDTADLQTIIQSNQNAGNMKVYLGTTTQLPDPMMEANLGTGNVPAYLGRAYVSYTSLDITEDGARLPNFKYEIVGAASAANLATPVTYTASAAQTFIAAKFPPGDLIAYTDASSVSGFIQFVQAATGEVVGTRNLQAAILEYGGTNGLVCGRAAYDSTGNAWVFAYGTINTVNVGVLIGMRPGGEVFKVIYAYDYFGGGLNAHELAIDSDDWAYFVPTTTQYFRIHLPDAPEYPKPPEATTLTHRETLSPKPTAASSPVRDRDGNIYFVDTTNAVIYHMAGSGVVAVALVGAGPMPGLTYVPLWFDLNNDAWTAWHVGSGATRHAELKRVDLTDGTVIQSIVLPDQGASGNGVLEVIFPPDGFMYVYSVGAWRKYEISSGTQLYVTSGTTFSGANGTAVATRYATLISGVGDSTLRVLEPLPRLTLTGTQTLSSLVSDICTYNSALSAGDIDVTALTDTVDGYVIPRPMTRRAALEPLQKAYWFDVVESDGKIKFVKRGGAIAATIPADELGARKEGQGDQGYADIVRIQETEVPRQVTVNFWNKDAAYQDASEYARRLATYSVNDVAEEMPLCLSAEKAAQIAEVLLYDAHMGRTRYKFSTSLKYSKLEPTDVVDLTLPNATHRVRITNKSEEGLVLKFEGVAEDSAIYTPAALGATDQDDVTSVALPGPTSLDLLDIPILRSSDDDAGFYVRVGPVLTNWRGTQVFGSPDDVGFEPIGSLTSGTIAGVATTALGNYTGGNTIDAINILRVTLDRDGDSLDTVTELELYNGANIALLGSELLQFRDATLVSGRTFDITGFLRGRRGTELYIPAHAIGDRFVLLEAAGMMRVVRPESEIGTTRFYRAASFGETLANTPSQSLTNRAHGLFPLPVVLLRAVRNTPAANDWEIKWVRRGRVDWDWRDAVDVPIGEDSEAYEVDIVNQSTGVIVRTITATTNSATYLAADQTTDFGIAQTTLKVNVYQISAAVGRGFTTTGTF